MPKEVQTDELVRLALDQGKKVWVPVVEGPHRTGMRMVHLRRWVDLEDASCFIRSKWGIPEPVDTYRGPEFASDDDAGPDLIVMPGLAFDAQGRRCGRGKGYYDTYLARLGARRARLGHPPACTMAVCFGSQVVDEVPVADHDIRMDWVLSPTGAVLTPQTTAE